MRIILHIGMQKTGTTSLQEWFGQNNEAIEKLGWRFFRHPLQIMRMHERVYDPDWVRAEVARADKDGMTDLVFSAEGISTFSAEHVADIVSLFSGYPVEIVLCLRHWSGFLPSRWGLCCLWGDTQSFPSYLDALEGVQFDHMDANYQIVVDRAERAGADKLAVISFNNALRQGGLLPAFLESVNFPSHALENTRLANFNKRPGIVRTELARLFSGVRNELEGRSLNAMYDAHLTATPSEVLLFYLDDIAIMERNAPDLLTQIGGRISDAQLTDWRACLASCLSQWERMAADAAGPYLLNPIGGKLFAEKEVDDNAYSTIEIGDLSPALKRRMYDAFKRASEERQSAT